MLKAILITIVVWLVRIDLLLLLLGELHFSSAG